MRKILLIMGIIFILSPFFLYWFIHGDYERYIWIINGPFPFSHFGGGPTQLFMYVSLFFFGIVFFILSFVFKKKT